ncbi:MAG: hypothetical protein PHV34_21890 [Verrucomicrobiae bacterium]|nr:hypothetical protein [Verrucomicrobiae bacterium]
MQFFSKLLLLIGVACFTYGIARVQISVEILSRQDRAFDAYFKTQSGEFFKEHAKDSPKPGVWDIPPPLRQLHHSVMMGAGMGSDWHQAVPPCALGFILAMMAWYFGQVKGKRTTSDK